MRFILSQRLFTAKKMRLIREFKADKNFKGDGETIAVLIKK